MSFTSPDFSSTFDILWTVYYVAFIPIAALANTVNIPLMGRTAGLLTYSKFANGTNFSTTVPTQVGMLILYSPAALWAAWVLISGGYGSDSRGTVAALLILVHFVKRDLECLFVHKYSGSMPLTTGLFISVFYSGVSYVVCYYGSRTPAANLSGFMLLVGLVMFVVGLAGNYYHHNLLANLRKPGEKGYKIPAGGGFEYVATPHYFFELIGWYGVAFATQHVIAMLVAMAMTAYLGERAVAQTEWNVSKLDGYPKDRKHILPFLF